MREIQVELIIGQYKEKIQLGFVAQISSFKSVFEQKKMPSNTNSAFYLREFDTVNNRHCANYLYQRCLSWLNH